MDFNEIRSVYIIAEAGVNHNGDKELALRLIDAAAAAGADAVKFQTFNTEKLVSKNAPKAEYQKKTSADVSQFEMLKKLELPYALHHDLMNHAKARDIDFISTAFDEGSLDFLVSLDIPFFKVPSGELTNLPLLWKFGRTGRPLVVSTGMATLAEVEQALAVIVHSLHHEREPVSLDDVWMAWGDVQARRKLSGHVVLLHCTSQYPTPMPEVNLKSMNTLASAFDLPVGYSDHTEGILVPVAAVARGACVIEKHFTLDRTLPGPDHQASLEPDELRRMVQSIRELEVALGSEIKAPNSSEWDTRRAVRKQVIAACPIKRGETITRDHLATARTGGVGRSASQLWDLVGSVSPRDYAQDEKL